MPNTPNYNVRPITQQTVGTEVLASNIYTAVDVTDPTQTPGGTSKQYSVGLLQNYLKTQITGSNKTSCIAACPDNLDAEYFNGEDGVGATLTCDGPLSALIVDDVTIALNDRVLVGNQTDEIQNGIYYLSIVGDGVTPWVLTRTTDYDNGDVGVIREGDFVAIAEGTLFALTFWLQLAPGPIVLGTDDVIFATVAYLQGTANEIDIVDSHLRIATNPVIPGLTVSQAVVTNASGALHSLGYASNNTASTLVLRDASGNFLAGTVKAHLEGNADTATMSDISQAITTNEEIADQEFYPVFVSNLTGDLPGLTGSGMTFNPSTSTLTVAGQVVAPNITNIIASGTFTPATGATTDNITVGGVSAGDFLLAYVSGPSANPFYIVQQHTTTNHINFTYSTAPGAGGTMSYVVYRIV